MKNFETIDLTKNGHFATIWLNRKQVKNAIDPQMIEEILAALEHLKKDEDIRALVISGKGDVFSAGADLNWMKKSAKYSYDQNLEDGKKLQRLFQGIYSFPKPTIAQVHGVAMGGALGIIAACDNAFCARDTIMAFSEVQLGLVPATIAPYVVKKIGEFAAKDLMFSARIFNGEEAARIGLANRAIIIGDLEPEVMKYLSFYKKTAPGALIQCKQMIHKVVDGSFENGELDQFTIEQIAKAKARDEGVEGMEAFIGKRKPAWIIP
jgi:methylglutaconyl-CoA hydratase